MRKALAGAFDNFSADSRNARASVVALLTVALVVGQVPANAASTSFPDLPDLATPMISGLTQPRAFFEKIALGGGSAATDLTNTSTTPGGTVDTAPAAVATGRAHVLETYGRLPMGFEANLGQSGSSTDFVARGSGYAVALASDRATIALRSSVARTEGDFLLADARFDKPGSTAIVEMRLVGSDTAAPHTGLDELPGRTNYYLDNDPTRWRTNIPSYAKVKYHAVYQGIDLVYYGNQRELEYDFVIGPGASPTSIRFAVEGVDQLEINSAGDLVMRLAGGDVRLRAPIAYQDRAGGRGYVAAMYQLLDAKTFGFAMGPYDNSLALVIDPALAYSTFLGGSGFDFARGIAVDATGAAHVVGETASTNFPTTTGSASSGGNDAFVTKLNPSGTSLVYSTFFGGSGNDAAFGIALAGSGQAYVVGNTESSNFPATTGAFQSLFKGTSDGFIARLDSSGLILQATYLGGSGADSVLGAAVGPGGEPFVLGQTASTDFPTTTGGYQTAYGGGTEDVFVGKLDAALSSLSAATYLGGSDQDLAGGIAVGSSAVYLSGTTVSTNFPTTSGALKTTNTSGSDAFVTKLNVSLSAPLGYSTFLGGSTASDFGHGLAIDSSGNAYVAGETASTDLATSGAAQASFGGGIDAYVAKLNAAGSGLVYATYIGGSSFDHAFAIAVDGSGAAYVTGQTESLDFPTVAAFQASMAAGSVLDVFVTKVNSAGSAFTHSSYLGGAANDAGTAVALDSSQSAYVAGVTSSTNFPITTGAFDTTANGGDEAFVTKIGSADANVVGVGAFPTVRVNRSAQISVDVLNNSTSTWTTGTTTEIAAVLQDVAGSAFTLNSWSATGCTSSVVSPGQICTLLVTVKPSDLGLGKVDFSVRYVSGAALDSEHVVLQATGTATFLVNQTDDGFACDDPPAPCTLRGAINQANAVPGRDAIGFKFGGTGPFTIAPTTPLPGTTDPVIIDVTNTQGPQDVVLDGSNLPSGAMGLRIEGGDSILRGLVVSKCPDNGVVLEGTIGRNVLEGNFLGTDETGSIARGNLHGLFVATSENVIGGATFSQRNVISGNTQEGLIVAFSGTNKILRNYIGTNASGTGPVSNGFDGLLIGTTNNTITENVISGNGGHGVTIGETGNQLTRNRIGTNAAGTAAIANARSGIYGFNGPNVIEDQNVISGNRENGLLLDFGGDTVQGNLIGTNATGNAAIPNQLDGVLVSGAHAEFIGAGNIISGNLQNGVHFVRKGIQIPFGTITGNYIGLGLDGVATIPNGNAGVFIDLGAAGPPVAASIQVSDNLIAKNRAGIIINSLSGGQVDSNIIGSTATGVGVPQLDEAISVNFSDGVKVLSNIAQYSSEGVYINDSTATLVKANSIQHNTGDGVFVVGAASQRNSIFVDAGSIWNNGGKGIRLDPGANGDVPAPIVDSVDTSSGLVVSGRGTSGARLDIHADAEDEGHYFLGTTTVDGTGHWTKGSGWFVVDITPLATAIRVGDLRVTATQTDVNGNTSQFSGDQIPPAAPRVDIVPAYVNVANQTAVSVTVAGEVGTTASGSIVSTGGGTMNVFVGTIPPSGTLSVTTNLSGLADGTVQAAATLRDAANNVSPPGTDTAIKDTAAPQPPSQPCIQGATDCKTTNVSQPTFTGNGAEANSTVGVYFASVDGPVLVCSSPAGVDGSYRCTSSTELGTGDFTFWANATDAAGNTSLNSTDTTCNDCGKNSGGPVTVDTAPPSATMTNAVVSTTTPILLTTASDVGTGVSSVQFQRLSGSTWVSAATAITVNPPVTASATYQAAASPALPTGANQIRALITDKAGNQNPSAAVTITVDTAQPSSAITFPANGGFYNASGWNSGCGSAAICGTATDGTGGSGLARVQVSIKRNSDNKYWDGSGFNATTETFRDATGTSNWSFPFAIPADNSYLVHAQAIDNAGLRDTGPTAAFTTDTVAPDTTLTGRPANPSTGTVSFQFSSPESNVTFRCQLDALTILCSSPRTYSLLAVGNHTFTVTAVDRAGNADPTPVSFTWAVDGDTDGDGLLNSWEMNGVWYNPVTRTVCAANTAGCQVVNLPAMGADVNIPNVFVQLDWMADSCRAYRPSFDAIKKVVDAFALKGIRLRVDMGSDSPLDYATYPTSFTTWGALSKARQLTELQTLGSFTGNFYNWTRPSGDTSPKFFEEIKQEASGFVSSGREPFFRYAIFADRINTAGTSGISRSNNGSGGSDFIVSLGAFAPSQTCGSSSRGIGTVDDQTGTFMHELGHGLGLGHGGNTGYNNKPDYPSIMSYAYQNTGVIRNNGSGNYVAGNFDYSSGTLGTLDETSLIEVNGLGAAAANFGLRRYCASTGLYVTSSPSDTNVDWNCDSTIAGASTPINTDVTGDSERNQDAVCVSGGTNAVIDSTLAGDDYVWSQTLAGLVVTQVVRSGRDRVCATAAGGDDLQTAAVGTSPPSEFLNDYNDWARVRLITGSVGQPGFRPAPPPSTEVDDTFTPAEKAKYVKSDIGIRVNPGSPSPINLNSPNVLVGVFSTKDFDATKLVTGSVGFGPRGAKPTGRADKDYNGDGIIDAGFLFTTSQTGLRSGDTQACLTGTVQKGNTETSVQGCDTVKVK